MVSRIKYTPTGKIQKKQMYQSFASSILFALEKHLPNRWYGRMSDGNRGFYTLASSSFVRISSAYPFFDAWTRGRKRVVRPRNKPMVFFPDPTMDPRVAKDYPRKKRNKLRLSKSRFRALREAGDLIVTNETRKLTKQDALIKQAADGLQAGLDEARKLIREQMRDVVKGSVRASLRSAISGKGLRTFSI